MNEAVIIGAGKTGRGFVARLLTGQGIRMRFIDKDRQLVDRLNAAGSFEIRYFGTDKTTRVEGYTAHTWEDADLSGDELIFVSVCSQNLADVGRELKKRLDPEREHYIITCENATDPARILREQLDSERVHISEATVFCTTVEAGGCDIGSEEYPWLQYDVESLGGFRPEIPGLKPVRNFSAFLKRKLYTYNAASCVIAYLGWLKGCTDYAEAANDEVIGRLLDENYAETNAAVCREYGYDMADQQEFARLSKAKFCNRKIADTLERNARQPERKITRDERVIAPLLLIAKYGGDPRVLEMTAAAMLLYDGEGEEAWRAKVRDLGPAGVLRGVCGLGDEPALCEGILGYYELFTADKSANANLLDSLSRKKAELPPAHPA